MEATKHLEGNAEHEGDDGMRGSIWEVFIWMQPPRIWQGCEEASEAKKEARQPVQDVSHVWKGEDGRVLGQDDI